MIQIEPIRTDSLYYAYMESLLVASFPTEEYRDLNDLQTFTDSNPLFNNNVTSVS